MVFKEIKEAGEGGIIQKDIREKYKDLPDWKYHKVKGSFSRLIKKGLVFYTGEKIGRSKVMRCVDLEKLDIFKEEK